MTATAYLRSGGVWVDIFNGQPPNTPTATSRSSLVAGTYKPSAATVGLLPGWTRSQLQTLSGTQTITTGNQTITGFDFRGTVRVQAPNVTFSNCWFAGPPTASSYTGCVDARAASCTGLIVADSVVCPDVPSLWVDGIVGHDYTARRVDSYHGVDAFGVFNTANSNGPANVLIEGSWGHDLAYFTGDPNHSDGHTHNDGLQIQGNSATTVRGSILWGNIAPGVGNAASPYAPSGTGQALGVTPNVGQVTGLLVEDSWLDYGAQSITIITGGFAGSTVGTIRRNKFGHNQPLLTKSDGAFRRAIGVVPAQTLTGMVTSTGPDTQGNVYEDSGLPVTVYRETYF